MWSKQRSNICSKGVLEKVGTKKIAPAIFFVLCYADLMQAFARTLSSGLGIGYLPWFPGTWASIVALIPGVTIFNFSGWQGLLFAILVVFVVGWWSVHQLEGVGDAPWIVIDEVVGQWIALLSLTFVLPLGVYSVSAFVLFRFFDIWKPWVIGMVNRKTEPWAVMADDILAGIVALCILLVVQYAL